MATSWMLKCAILIAVISVVLAGVLLDPDKLDNDDDRYDYEYRKESHNWLKTGTKVGVFAGVVVSVAKLVMEH